MVNEYAGLTDTNEIEIDIDGDIILLQDYLTLMNLPKIGGITLAGDKTAAELALLSALAGAYETVLLSAVKNTHYVPVVGEGKCLKIPLSEFDRPAIRTVREIPADMRTGECIFLQTGG